MNQAQASVTRFAGLARDYARFRPSYPLAAIAAILDGLPASPEILDVGAGTGIATRLLADAGARVVAIEPNDDMRAIAEAAGLTAFAHSAADTGRPDRSADAVTVFQAFHWFANDRALQEFRRVLRPGGRLAIVWNERNRVDEFSRGVRALEEEYGERSMLAGADFSDDRLIPLLEHNGFTNVRTIVVPNEHALDADAVTGRLRSLSYAPKDPAVMQRFTDEMLALHARYRDRRGVAILHLNTEIFLGEAPV